MPVFCDCTELLILYRNVIQVRSPEGRVGGMLTPGMARDFLWFRASQPPLGFTQPPLQ